MVDIEPFYRWRESHYIAEDDERSPFFGRTYNDFSTENMVYNYVLNPHWDYFDSETLYVKILFVDYEAQVAILEFIGEWNDAIGNDIMHLKRNVIEKMLDADISKYILIMENVLNFHGDGDDYYAEWAEECQDSFNGGWIAMLNTYDHVSDELKETRLDDFVYFGADFNGINWRQLAPIGVAVLINNAIKMRTQRLR